VAESISPDEIRAILSYGVRTGKLVNAVAGELLVRLTPERVIAKTGVAD
jgi:hypothetical protein